MLALRIYWPGVLSLLFCDVQTQSMASLKAGAKRKDAARIEPFQSKAPAVLACTAQDLIEGHAHRPDVYLPCSICRICGVLWRLWCMQTH